MLGKLSSIVGGRSQNEKDLESQLNDMQERYNALKLSHDATLQILSKSKQSDNSILEAYERLKKQFADLTLYTSVKRNEDFERLKLQQEELSRQKDLIDAREKHLNLIEKQINLKAKCIEISESGKSFQDIVQENEQLFLENQEIAKKFNILTERFKELAKKDEEKNRKLRILQKMIKECKIDTDFFVSQIEEMKQSQLMCTSMIMKAVIEKETAESKASEEKKKNNEKCEAKKSVIPAFFKKKATASVKKEDIDIEKVLGNISNS